MKALHNYLLLYSRTSTTYLASLSLSTGPHMSRPFFCTYKIQHQRILWTEGPDYITGRGGCIPSQGLAHERQRCLSDHHPKYSTCSSHKRSCPNGAIYNPTTTKYTSPQTTATQVANTEIRGGQALDTSLGRLLQYES